MTLSSTGAVSGTPTSPGLFVFTAQVTDANSRTAQRAIELNVIGALRLSPESLPEATRLLEYNTRLTVQGGLGPYQWSIQGDLPPGLVFEDGLFRGAPTAIGSFPLTVTVRDSRQRSLTRPYTLVVAPGVTILTTSLPAATATEDYQTTLAAEGGRPPYRWLISSALPEGLSLNPATGQISGRPANAGSFSLNVRVEDQNNLFDTATLALTVNAPTPPPLRITDLPAASPPAQQPTFAVVLDQPYPLPLQGEVELTFEPTRGPDDPAVQFANGSRRLPFTVPAGQMRANFVSPAALQTGTVAGLVTLTSRYSVSGVDVTPTPAPRQTLRIDPAAPVLTRLDLTRSANSFQLVVFGFSTPRDITRATVRLTAAPGATLTSSELTIDLNSLFTTWYNSSTSFPFGSQFRLTLPFTLTGSAADISSVSVTLTNSVGTSNSLSSNF
jgi:large repetitive protein